MGSSAPSAPAPPDPTTTASAQGSANASDAVAQTLLNNPNQITPYGTSTTAATGSYSYTEPDGSTTTIPTFTTTQTLSPQQQQLLNQQQGLSTNFNAAAFKEIGNVDQSLNNPITEDSLPPLTTSLSVPTLQSSYDQGGSIATGYNQGGSIATGYDTGPSLAYGYNAGGPIQSNVNWTAEGTNAPSSFGQTSSAIQNDVNLNTNAPTTFGATQNGVQYFAPQDFSSETNAATNAVLQRLAPTMAAQQESMNASLASQGLTQGSAAWNAAQLSQNQANNDLRLGAVATGDQEQQALFGEQAQANQLYNSAQQQDYNEQLGRGQFAQAGIAQNNAAALDEGQFHNAAQEQDFDQLDARAQYAQNAYGMNNAAIGANNTAALNAGEFANAAQAQQNSQNAAATAFYNSTVGQQNEQNAALAAFGNAAQAQQNQENAAGAAFSNTAQAQQNQENAAGAAFSNQTAQGLFGMNQAAGTFGNQAAEQQLQDEETISNNAINQASSLLHGGQVTTTPYQGYSAGQIGTTPISADTYSSANEAEQEYAQQMQASSASNTALMGGLTGLFGMGGNYLAGKMPFTPSDRRLKRDIIAFGPITGGLPVYAYRYVWDEDDAPLTMGHMADEVAAVRPEAVLRHPSGFDMVDYGAL